MPDFKSIADLEKYLLGIMEESMEDVGEHAEKIVSERVQKDVYDAYDPSYYDRTYQLKNSLQHNTFVKKRAKEVYSKINHNFRQIRASKPWTHHSIVQDYNPQNYAKWIPVTVHDGTTGLIMAHPEGRPHLRAFELPRPYMRNAWNQMRSSRSHITSLKRALGKRGIRSVDG